MVSAAAMSDIGAAWAGQARPYVPAKELDNELEANGAVGVGFRLEVGSE